jgi:hypothetical protein
MKSNRLEVAALPCVPTWRVPKVLFAAQFIHSLCPQPLMVGQKAHSHQIEGFMPGDHWLEEIFRVHYHLFCSIGYA